MDMYRSTHSAQDFENALKNIPLIGQNGNWYLGEYDTGIPARGPIGQRGAGTYRITTAPSSYTTATGGFTPKYRVALSTVKSQGGITDVFAGDVIIYSYYTYPVGYVDSSYVYLGDRVSIRGTAGAAGATSEQVIAALTKETWTFTLENGTSVDKVVPLV